MLIYYIYIKITLWIRKKRAENFYQTYQINIKILIFSLKDNISITRLLNDIVNYFQTSQLNSN